MLRKISLFSDLNDTEILEIEQILSRKEYSPGEVVFHEGTNSRDLYIIESGQIEILVRDVLMIPKTIAVLKKGEFFGEMAILDPAALRSATARALTACVLFLIPFTKFNALLHGDSNLSKSINAKMMKALSLRLRETTKKAATLIESEKDSDTKIITIASPRSGAGKTTLAVTMAQILSREIPKKTLLIDLDIFFSDATFLLGIHSDKSICNFISELNRGAKLAQLSSYMINLSDNLYVLPAPKSILETEEITPDSFSLLINTLKEHFDYIILDTDGGISDLILSAIESSDLTVFLIDKVDFLSVKNSVRYFHALSRFNFSEDKISIFLTRMIEEIRPESFPKINKFSISGILPGIPEKITDYGKTLYQLFPCDKYCFAVREIIQRLLKENLTHAPTSKKTLSQYLSSSVIPKDATFLSVPGCETMLETPTLSIPDTSLNVLLHDAKNLMIQGYREEAQAKIRNLLYFCNDSPKLYQLLGETLSIGGNFSEATIVMKKTLELDPGNHLAMGILGQITFDRKLIGKAISTVSDKIARNPNFPDLHNDLGRLYLIEQKNQESIKAFRKALEHNPGFVEARINLAISLAENNEFDSAIHELNCIGSKGVRVWYLIGCFQHILGNFPEAYESFNNAARHKPDYIDLQERLAKLQNYINQIETLISMHIKNIETNSGFPDLHFNLANLYLAIGKKDEAELSLMEALRLYPGYKDAREKLDILQGHAKKQAARSNEKKAPLV
ncbi:MAG: cyclic nucleotide-binding domain-containing protein [Candidatus Riflebacteria bacterium]|nr:cyclic nucleotide-binding domain-containing protein [Candidatus Riflebacteria bacterium]